MSESNPNTPAFERTRRDHATEIAEDYVEAIAQFIDSNGSCRVTELAEHFGVTHVTVIKTIQRLERDGLVKTEPYKPVELTQAGMRMAQVCKERHEIVYEFLLTIGVDRLAAEVDAEGIEHHVSPATLAAFKRIVENRGN